MGPGLTWSNINKHRPVKQKPIKNRKLSSSLLVSP